MTKHFKKPTKRELANIKLPKRWCDKCDEMFFTVSKYNKICNSCKQKSADERLKKYEKARKIRERKKIKEWEKEHEAKN